MTEIKGKGRKSKRDEKKKGKNRKKLGGMKYTKKK